MLVAAHMKLKHLLVTQRPTVGLTLDVVLALKGRS
jgi:hypothetical protein